MPEFPYEQLIKAFGSYSKSAKEWNEFVDKLITLRIRELELMHLSNKPS